MSGVSRKLRDARHTDLSGEGLRNPAIGVFLTWNTGLAVLPCSATRIKERIDTYEICSWPCTGGMDFVQNTSGSAD